MSFFTLMLVTDCYTLSLHDALPICLFLLGRYTAGRGTTRLSEVATVVPGKSIAVLPLINESGDPKDEYFSDGLSERSEEHTSELQSHSDLVCRLLLEKKKIRKDACY